jgi:putative flippase GtrA
MFRILYRVVLFTLICLVGAITACSMGYVIVGIVLWMFVAAGVLDTISTYMKNQD